MVWPYAMVLCIVDGDVGSEAMFNFDPLTIFGDFQDVADEGAVSVKGLGPCEVDGPLLRDAQDCYWVFWSMGQLPA